MAAYPSRSNQPWRRSPLVWCAAIGVGISVASLAYVGFVVVRWVAADTQAFGRWDHHTVAADEATIDGVILPAIEAYARREGRLPASLGQLVAAGDLTAVPASQAGVWMYYTQASDFTIGVGDPPYDYPCAYRVIELRAPGDVDPSGWIVRDWYHDT